VAILGVWNRRGSNAHADKVALPDWESIVLNGRDIHIALDSDVMQKAEVHKALVRLKAFLESHSASVKVIYLPAGDSAATVARGNTTAPLSLWIKGATFQQIAAAEGNRPPAPQWATRPP
jgi:hypothetical protein